MTFFQPLLWVIKSYTDHEYIAYDILQRSLGYTCAIIEKVVRLQISRCFRHCITSIYSLVYSHTHGCHAQFHTVGYLVAQCQRNWRGGMGNQILNIFCYDHPVEVTSLHISTKKIRKISIRHYLNKVLLLNLTQFLIQGIPHKPQRKKEHFFLYIF